MWHSIINERNYYLFLVFSILWTLSALTWCRSRVRSMDFGQRPLAPPPELPFNPTPIYNQLILSHPFCDLTDIWMHFVLTCDLYEVLTEDIFSFGKLNWAYYWRGLVSKVVFLMLVQSLPFELCFCTPLVFVPLLLLQYMLLTWPHNGRRPPLKKLLPLLLCPLNLQCL